MVQCDDCGTEVSEVWRHREFADSMTHREISWICRSCHPAVAETTTVPAAGTPVTDGGTEQ